MPRRYPLEMRRQVIELARSGTRVKQLSPADRREALTREPSEVAGRPSGRRARQPTPQPELGPVGGSLLPEEACGRSGTSRRSHSAHYRVSPWLGRSPRALQRSTTSRRLDARTPASCSLPSLCSATISPITTMGSAATLSCRRRPGPRSAESCSRSSAHRTRRPQQVRSLLHSLHHAPHQADVPWHQHRPAGPGPQAQPGPAVQPRRVWISPASVEVELHEDNKVPRDGVPAHAVLTAASRLVRSVTQV